MKLLEKLTGVVSVSGREQGIRELILSETKNYADEIIIDNLGNLIVRKKGNGKKLMLAAHMDEIGFVVTYIDENGFLRFGTVGGINAFNCINEAVMFENGTAGVISYENKEKPSDITFSKMYIDIGAKNKEEAEKKVAIGDMAGFLPHFNISGDKIIANTLDDRVGCYVLIEALKNADSDNDLYFAFTVQEEVGLRGAKVCTNAIAPDMAVAVDVSYIGDTPNAEEVALSLGKGPAIKVKDASFIIHPAVKEALIACAKGAKTDYQIEAAARGGTDAGAISLSGSGVPAGTISIPTRYIHSANETADIRDISACVKMVTEFINTTI